MRELFILAIHLLITFVNWSAQVACAPLPRSRSSDASTADQQSLPPSRSESDHARSRGARTDHPVREPTPDSEARRADQAGNALLFHKALVERKCRLLFSSSSHRRKPGPKGPSAELIAAIVEMKRRNPRFGCVRIAQQIAHAFGVEIDKDVVQRVLAGHYRPGDAGTNGPS